MLEAVGHEFMEKFFSSCNSLLAENGILVLQVIDDYHLKNKTTLATASFFKSNIAKFMDTWLQFISIPDERYDEYRRSSDFIKEYIFPGGCLPSLSRVTTAMTAASRLW